MKNAARVAKDRIRYLLYINGRWRWRPTKAMRAKGFHLINLSAGGPERDRDGNPAASTADKMRAITLNHEWDCIRRGLPISRPRPNENDYPPGSIGDGYQRAMKLRAAERKAKDIGWTKEQESRDDWPRAWKWIKPDFAEVDPRTVQPEHLIDPDIDGLRPKVAAAVSESEAHRVIKVWRALWKKMAAMGYCDRDSDPSLTFANSAPDPRQRTWSEGEVVRIVKQAWRDGYHGLAALLAVAWDSQLSPVDVRRLKAGQRRQDRHGAYFEAGRAKTGREAIATLSRRSERLLDAYLAELGAATPHAKLPIFRNRSGAPYSKDTLGDDFRAVRAALFGRSEDRQLQDFRRSGAVEAIAGDADPAKLSGKMANTLSESNRLHATYVPNRVAVVRAADEARKAGRARLREQTGAESVTAPVRKVSQPDRQSG